MVGIVFANAGGELLVDVTFQRVVIAHRNGNLRIRFRHAQLLIGDGEHLIVTPGFVLEHLGNALVAQIRPAESVKLTQIAQLSKKEAFKGPFPGVGVARILPHEGILRLQADIQVCAVRHQLIGGFGDNVLFVLLCQVAVPLMKTPVFIYHSAQLFRGNLLPFRVRNACGGAHAGGIGIFRGNDGRRRAGGYKGDQHHEDQSHTGNQGYDFAVQLSHTCLSFF